jgi:cysteinyl-tRNA synthetase
MSKSLGNFFTVRDLLDQGVPGEVIRFVMLSTHYRKPMDWTEKKREDAEKTLRDWYRLLHSLNYTNASVASAKELGDWLPSERVIKVLSEDLNTHQALTELKVMASIGLIAELAASLDFLGLVTNWDKLGEMATVGLGSHASFDLNAYADLLRDARAGAMATKNFTVVDKLKKKLLAAGVEVRMSKDGVEVIAGPKFDPTKLEALK